MKQTFLQLVIAVAVIGVQNSALASESSYCGRPSSETLYGEAAKFLIQQTVSHCKEANANHVIGFTVCDSFEDFSNNIGGFSFGGIRTLGGESIIDITVRKRVDHEMKIEDEVTVHGLLECDTQNNRLVLFSTDVKTGHGSYGFAGLKDYEPKKN